MYKERGVFGRPKRMYKAICADCRNECEVPFRPAQERPVYCRECFPRHRPSRRRSEQGRHRFSRRHDTRGPREMHKTVCGDCGEICEVPFEPTQGRPTYCRKCLEKHKPPRRYR